MLQEAELYTFGNSGFIFRWKSRNFSFRFVVDDGDVFGTAADRGAGRIHSHVACADNDNVVTGVQQCFAGIQLASVSQYHHTQEVGCCQNTGQFLAGDVQRARQRGTCAHENCIIALGKKVIYGKIYAGKLLGADFHTDMLQLADFTADNILLQTEFRNAEKQYAAGLALCFENSNIEIHFGQIACYSKTCRAGADYGNLTAQLA